jgi:hypothetical protein
LRVRRADETHPEPPSARAAPDVGLAGFALKSHYVSTAERAAVVNETLGGEVRALGAAATLNASVGGMNPLAATGHLSAFETRAVANAAFGAGVHQVIATHPEFPQQDLGRDDQLALARQGAFLERCFTTPFTGKYEWARMV